MMKLKTLFVLYTIYTVRALRIAIGSCHSQKEDHDGMWNVITQTNPDHLVLLGDNIYADEKMRTGKHKPALPDYITAQYNSLAANEAWQELVTVIGGYDNILATWDDHDYGVDNGDSSYQYRNESLQAFLDFFQYSNADKAHFLARGGVYTSKTYHEGNLTIKYIMLDTRYFKDPPRIPQRDILGETQWSWLESELQDTSSDVIFLGSSIQVLPTQKIVEETWSDFPAARSRLLRLLDTAPCPNIFILSGDVHTAEVNQAQCGDRNLTEFTSSGLSHTFVWKIIPTLQNSSTAIPAIKSRGWLNIYLFTLYQAMYPARHREHKYADIYRGIHFALIDISSSANGASHELVFHVVNHKGDVVRTRSVMLLPKSQCAARVHAGCDPYWGSESRFSFYLFKFVMVLGIAFVCLVPMVIFGILMRFHRQLKQSRIISNKDKNK